MKYPKALHYLNSFLNLERILWSAENRVWNLKRMRFLIEAFGHPEKTFFPILIAGTKGKGSTGFFLESILKASGIRVGFYCSPHLEDVRERIRVDGRTLSPEAWAEGLSEIRRRLKARPVPSSLGEVTYFEILTLLAIQVFSRRKVRVGIFEVGMGGRLDATNVLEPRVVILTPIHLDHEAMLGPTIPQIAREKAAVIKPKTDVIMGPQSRTAFREISKRVHAMRARLKSTRRPARGPVGLRGDFQKWNAAAAQEASKVLRDRYHLPVLEDALARGVRSNGWPGRLETASLRPTVLLDGAHNPSSIEALVRNLKRLYRHEKNRVVVFGVFRDKNSPKMLQILGSFFPDIILSPIQSPRSQDLGPLMTQAKPYFRSIYPASGLQEALKLLGERLGSHGMGVVTGSFYLIGEARRLLRRG